MDKLDNGTSVMAKPSPVMPDCVFDCPYPPMTWEVPRRQRQAGEGTVFCSFAIPDGYVYIVRHPPDELLFPDEPGPFGIYSRDELMVRDDGRPRPNLQAIIGEPVAVVPNPDDAVLAGKESPRIIDMSGP